MKENVISSEKFVKKKKKTNRMWYITATRLAEVAFHKVKVNSDIAAPFLIQVSLPKSNIFSAELVI